MNLVTAQRTSQQDLAKVEIEVGKLTDHVDDVDEHLRGVAGNQSLDVRVTLLQSEIDRLKEVNRHFLKKVDALLTLEKEVAALSITKAVAKETESTRSDRAKIWLGFWGPIILVALAWVQPLARFTVNNWAKFRAPPSADYRPDERLRKEIEADKKGARGKAVRKKLADLERATTTYRP